MKGNSSEVRSSQPGIHPRLDAILARHLQTPWRQPLHRPTVEAFARLSALQDISRCPLILDSGCGTGASTKLIGDRHPDCLVLGVDQSASRLGRLGLGPLPAQQGNTVFVQAELATFWRLAHQAGWRLERHYLLYPNPWPKPAHVLRRWHAHPVFPQMLSLGGVVELRCNWRIYAQEFKRALEVLVPGIGIAMEEGGSEAGWDSIETPFGRKYAQSGHHLYRLKARLPSDHP